MAIDSKPQEKSSRRNVWLITIIACLSVVIVTFAMVRLIQSTEPTAQRVTASKKGAMLVETTQVEKGTYRPQISVMGLVQPSETLSLRSRVEGAVIQLSDLFEVGSFVNKGEWLLKLDPEDYQNAVAIALSGLHQAESELLLEKGQREVAKNEYALMREVQAIPVENASLILREPQWLAANAGVEAAQALLDQARIELSRTELGVPFDAQILSRNVSLGSLVSEGQEIARLVGIDRYWVTASVPIDKLSMIEIPGPQGGPSSNATVRNRASWQPGLYRLGKVASLIGSLDDRTRLAQLNISVEDPLALQETNSGKPALMIGSLLQVMIEGREIADVIRLDRSFLRENDTVWIMEDGKLRISSVNVVFRDEQFAYIRSGLESGDEVVTTGLSAVIDGAPLRKNEPNLTDDLS
jgi:RND family efflux transporter MFP subunit